MEHGAATSFPLLTSLIVVPFAGALLVAALPRMRPELAKILGFVVAAATGAIALFVLTQYEANGAQFQFVSRHDWIRDLGVSWKLGIDGISLFLVVLTGVLFPIGLAGPKVTKDVKSYVAWMLLLEAGCMGVFVSLDLFCFFVFWELVLVPMYMLIGGWGHEKRIYAALKFFLYTALGSALMLVAILTVAFLHDGGPTFDLVRLANDQDFSRGAGRWLFLAFSLSFAIKVPIFPLHTWLPDAHTEAPTAGSVILAGVMLKLGTYGFLRFGLYLFPEATVWFAPTFLTLGVIGITYGAIVAAMQKDLKRLVAYSSVAHLGFVVLGTFALTTQGLQGGLLQMVNHGLSTSALFLLVGMIYERRHTREIAELRGLQKPAPIMAGVFILVVMASIGLPGLNGFVGEFLVLLGTFLTHRWWAVVAATGVILSAVYLLWAYQRVFHGEPDEANADFREMTWREGAVLAPLLALIVFLGVYPKPVLDRMEPSVDRLLTHVERHTDYRQPDVTVAGNQEARP